MSTNFQNNICIICRKNVPCDSEEHVFPATIGGGITIKICRSCNKSLGDRIDDPFVSSELILAFRNQYNLSRDGRNIKNPLRGKNYKDEKGRDYYVQIMDGIATKNLKPIFEQPVDLGNGQFFFKVTMPMKDVPQNPMEILELYKKRHGIEINNKHLYVVHTEKLKEENPTVQLELKNRIKFFQFLKIGYELACAISTDYFGDPHSELISKILHEGEINDENGYKIFSPEEAPNDILWFENRFTFLKWNPHTTHIALFSQEMDGILKVYISIFNQKLVIRLSETTTKFINNELFFFNDCIEGKGNKADLIPTQYQMKTYVLNFDERFMNDQQKRALLPIIMSGNRNWHMRNGQEIVFDSTGNETPYTIHSIHEQGLNPDSGQEGDIYPYKFGLLENTFFLKSEVNGFLFPLKSVIYHLQM